MHGRIADPTFRHAMPTATSSLSYTATWSTSRTGPDDLLGDDEGSGWGVNKVWLVDTTGAGSAVATSSAQVAQSIVARGGAKLLV
jgi:hypothetical protein